MSEVQIKTKAAKATKAAKVADASQSDAREVAREDVCLTVDPSGQKSIHSTRQLDHAHLGSYVTDATVTTVIAKSAATNKRTETKPNVKTPNTTTRIKQPSSLSTSTRRTNSKQAAAVTEGQSQLNRRSVSNKGAQLTKETARQDSLSRSSGMLGSITGLFGDVLQGWAIDTDSPDALLAVEIYYDDVFGHLVRADEHLGGLQDSSNGLPGLLELPEGAQWHGFVTQLDKHWLSGASKLTARVANQGPWLSGTVYLGQGQSNLIPDQQANRVFHGGGLKLVGWAWGGHESKDYRRVSVFELVNGKQRHILSAEANCSLPDLSRKPQQGHGFVIDLPSALADGRRHRLEITTDQGEPVYGSPIELCLTANTLSALAKDAWVSGESLATVLPVISAYERQYPVSFGFNHYPAWCELYQVPPPIGETELRCAVLVITPANTTDTQTDQHADEQADRSVQSVFDQRLPEAQVECFKVSARSIIKGLQAAADMADVVVPLWAGDRLVAHALDVMATSLGTQRTRTKTKTQTQTPHPWGYADDDVFNFDSGIRTDPWLKPDWDETLFFSLDYVSHGVFLSSELVKAVLSNYADILNALTDEDDATTTWHAFMACVVAHSSSDNLTPVHVRQVLYQSPQRSISAQSRLSAMSWLANHQVPGARLVIENAATRVVWPMPATGTAPLVSIVVPTRNSVDLLRVAVQGVLSNTQYPAIELLVVDNDSDCEQTLAHLRELEQSGVRVLAYPKPFNYSAINNMAAEAATGDLLLFLNNDVEIVNPHWLTEMVVQFGRADVGIVGKKLLWPNGLVQHGGVVVGINGLAAHAFNDCWEKDPGYMGLNRVDREQSAVTAACLMIRREDFLAVGGLDETDLPVAFNDVDLCLRMRASGKRVVLTTRFPLIHHESASRGKEDTPQKQARARRERQFFVRRWMTTEAAFTDPYYHPGLNQDFLVGPYGGLGRVHDHKLISG